MRSLLHIIGSPRGERSRSREIAQYFLNQLTDVRIEELDLWAVPLPELDGPLLESRYRLIHGGTVEEGFEARWDELRARVDHLLRFDLWLFSTPMWNFGMPYRLKHYIDLLIQPTMAFSNDANGTVTPHGTEKIAVLIGAGALDIRPDSALAQLDFNLAHLEQCLRIYFGVRAVHQVRVSPTFGEQDLLESVMQTARARAEELAVSLSARGGERD